MAALVLTVPAASYKPGVSVACISSAEERERLKALSVTALDEAYQEQIRHLYEVWMRDPRGQPQRAQLGASLAARAWLEARKGMATFQPPECPR